MRQRGEKQTPRQRLETHLQTTSVDTLQVRDPAVQLELAKVKIRRAKTRRVHASIATQAVVMGGG